ncbi:hypothetical protein QZL89_28865, partial [Burkholderia multivorans]|nr:hypothetical protein [Burkholderia multivorans]
MVEPPKENAQTRTRPVVQQARRRFADRKIGKPTLCQPCRLSGPRDAIARRRAAPTRRYLRAPRSSATAAC